MGFLPAPSVDTLGDGLLGCRPYPATRVMGGHIGG